MKNKQDINVGCFLHPVRDVSLGRKTMHHGTLHPVRDASLTEYSFMAPNRYRLFIFRFLMVNDMNFSENL